MSQNFTAGEVAVKGTLVQINANGFLDVGKTVLVDGEKFETNGIFTISDLGYCQRRSQE